MPDSKNAKTHPRNTDKRPTNRRLTNNHTGTHQKSFTAQSDAQLAQKVRTGAARMLKTRRNPNPGVWFGLGMMGLIGWSVVVPTLLGAVLGNWLDKTYPDERSWTLALLIAGLTIGCFNAWHWLTQQEQAMNKEQQNAEEQQNTEDQENDKKP